MWLLARFVTGGEVSRTGERSDAACVGARFIAPNKRQVKSVAATCMALGWGAALPGIPPHPHAMNRAATPLFRSVHLTPMGPDLSRPGAWVSLPDSCGVVPRLAPTRAHPPPNPTPCHYILYPCSHAVVPSPGGGAVPRPVVARGGRVERWALAGARPQRHAARCTLAPTLSGKEGAWVGYPPLTSPPVSNRAMSLN